MPQSGKPLRGHQLAKDGLPAAAPQLVFCAILHHPLASESDDVVAAPDFRWITDAGSAPDQGYPLDATSTRQRFWLNVMFADATSGLMVLRLRKNGLNIGSPVSFSGPVPGSGFVGLASFGQQTFNAGDTWSIMLDQGNFSVGAGAHFSIAAHFYDK